MPNLRKRRFEPSHSGPDPRRRRPQNSGQVSVNIDGFNEQNTSKHHTDEYENQSLVLRRGGKFKLGLSFEGVAFPDVLGTILRFRISSRLNKFDDFVKDCKIVQNINDTQWQMKIVEKNQSQCRISVEVNIPVSAVIGRYSVGVVLPPASSDPVEEFEAIVLFNAWNKGDEVYLENDKERQEYVLNDTGIVYAGWGDHGPNPKYWNFAQFEEYILDCVIKLLERDERAKRFSLKALLQKRSSAVWISRVLSAMLNSQDEDGVLEGNWSGDYEDGESPMSWNGSEEIFRQYYITQTPVKYGQCWVFSGILTTALRALGIPARSVTNFDSAHDTDGTMTIDSFYDEDGDRLDKLSDDSVWNFHVWNEIWTKRKDLPGDSYDGWQAVDATPQEESSGRYQMGPAPLKAVKRGEIYAGFDTGFVFSEVNADRVKWTVTKDESGEYTMQKMLRQITRNVGAYISTKKVGSYEREDVTRLYKYEEGSAEEREAFAAAYSFGKGPQNWAGELNMAEEGNDLTIDLNTKGKVAISNGDAFTCIANVKNKSQRTITVNLVGVISSVQYNGQIKAFVKRERMDKITINAGKSIVREISVDPEEYLDKLSDSNAFTFVLVVKVLETKNQYVDDLNFSLKNSDCIEITAAEPLRVGQRTRIEVKFTNPLQKPLSGLKFTAEGAKLMRPKKKKYKRRLYAGRTKKVRFYLKPKKPGVRLFLIDVDSYQVKDMKSSKFFTVQS